MAVTVTELFRTKTSDRYLHAYSVTFDSSYPTGGEPLTAANLGFSDLATNLVVTAHSGGYTFKYDGANEKLLAYWVDTTVDGSVMLEVVAATNLSTVVVIVYAWGKVEV